MLHATETPLDRPLRTTVCAIGLGASGLLLTRRLVEAGFGVLALKPAH